MTEKPLNDATYLTFAMKHYNNPSCQDVAEFQNDLNRTVYIKRHLKKFVKEGEIKHRLLLNQMIVFTNVFGVLNGVRMICYKIDEELLPALKAVLIYLQYLPNETIPEVPELHKVPYDNQLMETLCHI
jgi:hypothetical protein